MKSDERCAVCGIQGQVITGPDEICYCPACYQLAYPNTLRGQRRSAARQRRILSLTLNKIRQSQEKARFAILH